MSTELQNWERENHILSYDLNQRDEERGWNEPDENYQNEPRECLPLLRNEYEMLLSLLIKVAVSSPSLNLIKGYFSIQEQGRFANHFIAPSSLEELESRIFAMDVELESSAPTGHLPLSGEELDTLLSLVSKVANAYPTDKVFSNLYTELESVIAIHRNTNPEGPNL